FSEEKRFIQLFSYQTKDRKGQAFSQVIEVVPRLRGKSDRLRDLPAIRLPENLSIMTSVQTSNNKRSFAFEETPLSAPMSWAALAPLISNLLPVAGNLLGGLLNKGGGAANSGTANNSGGTANGAPATNGSGGGGGLASVLTPENIKAIADIVIKLLDQNKTAVAKSMSGTVSPALLGISPTAAPVLGKLLTPEAITAIGNNPQKLYAALADAIVRLPDNELLAVKQELMKVRPLEATIKNPPTVYSEAKIAPALLAALPALIPLAEKAIGAIGDMNKEQNRHIEAIIPKGVNMDDALKQMLQSINTYNAVAALQPQAGIPAQQPVGQSLMMNALCNTIPLVEKAMSENSMDEFREKTEELVQKVHNEMIELQEDLKEKMAKMMPQLKTNQAQDATKGMSFYMEAASRGPNGNNIFGHAMANGNNTPHAKGIKLLTRVLPMAIATEHKKQKNRNKVRMLSVVEPSPDVKPDPAAELLLQKIEDGLQAKASANSIEMKESPAYGIEVIGSKTTEVNGVQKVLYVKDKGIAFALKLIANNGKTEPLAKAMVQIQVKNHNDSKVVAEKRFPLSNVTPGELPMQFRFEQHELNALPCNCDLLVHISFAWKTNKNETKGVRKTHAIMLTDGYVMGRTGETVKSGIPLNNVNTHRNFWHKVWESTSSVRNRTNIICRYYMHYDARAAQNTYVETKKQERRGSDSEYEKDDLFIKMKSGMEISPVALNNLLPGLSATSLNEQQLKALCHYEFKKQVDSAAESQLSFRNK
ncbi:MAG TPA: hypothetical protein VEB42_15850, partial [Chitinophagaceae bacterium]|nr:hypothetical protein [Chitinophagaceae bacterium]